ncbi:hypothetical protein RZS08_56300, partial [Arthrospira platensis SPKY1]|nr:hypothetical protein [Arthrospira platensis SPKY1]
PAPAVSLLQRGGSVGSIKMVDPGDVILRVDAGPERVRAADGNAVFRLPEPYDCFVPLGRRHVPEVGNFAARDAGGNQLIRNLRVEPEPPRCRVDADIGKNQLNA